MADQRSGVRLARAKPGVLADLPRDATHAGCTQPGDYPLYDGDRIRGLRFGEAWCSGCLVVGYVVLEAAPAAV